MNIENELKLYMFVFIKKRKYFLHFTVNVPNLRFLGSQKKILSGIRIGTYQNIVSF
jgi:hypothetical protein